MSEPNSDDLKEEFDLGVKVGRAEMREEREAAKGILLSLFDLDALTREDIVRILSI